VSVARDRGATACVPRADHQLGFRGMEMEEREPATSRIGALRHDRRLWLALAALRAPRQQQTFQAYLYTLDLVNRRIGHLEAGLDRWRQSADDPRRARTGPLESRRLFPGGWKLESHETVVVNARRARSPRAWAKALLTKRTSPTFCVLCPLSAKPRTTGADITRGSIAFSALSSTLSS
jgi:hypothetical protein